MANITMPTTQEGARFTGREEVVIAKASNGFIVRVGCKIFVMHSWKHVCNGLALYWKSPDAARAKFCPEDRLNQAVLQKEPNALHRNRRRKIGRNRSHK